VDPLAHLLGQLSHRVVEILLEVCDAGIVFLENRKPYVLVILTQFSAETGRGVAVAEVSRDIYNTLAGSYLYE